MTYGTRIQMLLKEQCISQRQLATKLHLAPNTLNGYIHGTRTPNCLILADIASSLNVSIDYLLGLTEVRQNPDTNLSENEKSLLFNYQSMDSNKREMLHNFSFVLLNLK